jgi:hypothetical protein
VRDRGGRRGRKEGEGSGTIDNELNVLKTESRE